MNISTRSIAIITGPETYLDHLGVLSQILNIPLIVTERIVYDLAKKFYPQLDVHFIEMKDLSLEFLAKNFDVIFQSGKFFHLELGPILENIHRKKMRFVFCPHGNSDKGFSLKNHARQDICLYYGDHMLDLLSQTGALEHINITIKTGNYRLPFYLKNKSFYDDLTEETLKNNLFTGKKTILYAPTWNDDESPSSFFSCCISFIEKLKEQYNLIIKLHPLLEVFHMAHTYEVTSHYENIKGVIFLKEFPPIYPILSLTDIYVGDFSSIGYDFLFFNRPMFFFNTMEKIEQNKRGYFLHKCGIEIPLDKLENIDQFIEEHLEICSKQFDQIRKETYHFAFGFESNFDEIKKEIFKQISL